MGRNLRVLSVILLVVGIGSVAVATGSSRTVTMAEWATMASAVAGPWIVAAVVAYVGSVLLTASAANGPDQRD